MTTAQLTTRRGNRLGPLLILGIVLAGLGYGIYWEFFQTYHLATVVPGVLYRDGSHSIRELRHAVQDVQPRTVVSLVDSTEANSPAKPQFKAEEQYLAQQKIKLVRIPVALGGWPDANDVKAFLATVSNPGDQPVLVHCAQGVRRTGMFVAAYQLSVLKWSKDQARAGIVSFGHSDSTLNDIRRFIDAYDPEKQELSLDVKEFKAATAE